MTVENLDRWSFDYEEGRMGESGRIPTSSRLRGVFEEGGVVTSESRRILLEAFQASSDTGSSEDEIITKDPEEREEGDVTNDTTVLEGNDASEEAMALHVEDNIDEYDYTEFEDTDNAVLLIEDDGRPDFLRDFSGRLDQAVNPDYDAEEGDLGRLG